MELLTVNAGSSSVRLARFRDGRAVAARRYEASAPDPLADFTAGQPVDAVAHRVVHAGARRELAAPLDVALEAAIARHTPLAPLHNPAALRWIDACRRAWPEARAVAVFDSGWFARLPERAARLPLPRGLVDELGLRRLGFHGLAHEAMWRAWGRGGRVVSLQLGSGCSAAAVADGAPVETSMGWTPLEGLMMSTRAGDLDPGVVLHLARAGGLGVDELTTLLDRRAGLLGVSGESGDLRVLLASSRPEARLAVEMFCARARQYLGAYLATLGGADAVLFGGGVGEHQPEIRARICEGLAFCGLLLDEAANRRAPAGVISARESRIAVRVIAVDEEALLAERALEALAPPPQ